VATPDASASSATGATADDILSLAESPAAAAHKNVLLVFSASWCVPCHMFEAFLRDPEAGPILRQYFVPARIDVGEEARGRNGRNTPGGEKMMLSFTGGRTEGYPFFVFLTAQGSPLVNSLIDGRSGKNIGYPAAPQEIDWFMTMLRQSTPAMTPTETKTIRKWLQKHTHG
jgi:hypothetical protein